MAIRWLYHARVPSIEEATVSVGSAKGPNRALVAASQALDGLTRIPDHASLVVLGSEDDFGLVEIAEVEERALAHMPNTSLAVGVGLREAKDGVVQVVIIC